MGLLILPIAVAWIFVPQIASAFAIKHHAASLGALAVALLWIWNLEKVSFPKGWGGVALIVWMAAVSISAASAANFHLAAMQQIETFALMTLVICLFNLRDLDTAQHYIEAGIMIAGGGVALFALKQYLLPELLDPGFHAVGKMKIYSTLGNPTLAALVTLAAVPLAAWRSMREAMPYRAMYAVLLALLLGGLLVTQSRNMLAAIGVMGLLALLWQAAPHLRKRLLILLLVVVGITAVIMLTVQLPSGLVHSIKGRWFIWLTSVAMMLDRPLSGVGLGQFGLNHLEYQGQMYASGKFDAYFDNAAVLTEGHNQFLNWGAEAGILGLVSFAVLCACVLWYGWKSASLKAGAPHLYLALAGYLFAMLFVSALSYPGTVFFFWLLFGMVMARSGLPRVEIRLTAWMRYAAIIFLGSLVLVDGNRTWREVNSGLHEAQGDKLMEQHDLWLANKEYQQALLWNPDNAVLHKKYATALFIAGDSRQALSELEEAKRGSGDLGIYVLEGEILTRLGELDQAVALYRQITASFPNMVGPHFILGQVYQLQGKQSDAEIEFRKVLDIKPSPTNLSMTVEKVELQKRIVRDYLHGSTENPGQAVELPRENETQD
jgi:putative inorganic carbon (HCO3(-)) transporter